MYSRSLESRRYRPANRTRSGHDYFVRHILCLLCLLLAWQATSSIAQETATSASDPGDSAATLFSTTCGVCHGSDGRGGERAPNIATKREVVSLSDAQLNLILHKGVLASGMPAFDYLGNDKILQLVSHLRHLQGFAGVSQVLLSGDAAEGEKDLLRARLMLPLSHDPGQRRLSRPGSLLLRKRPLLRSDSLRNRQSPRP